MNDIEIRANFHKTILHSEHSNEDTRVIDELGLNHGQCRADIAVVNGHLIGYEIKSNNDSLIRLRRQIQSYNSIFDKAYIICGDRFKKVIKKYVPKAWGIIVAFKNKSNAITFDKIREAETNLKTDPLSIARLLWRNEAAEILHKYGAPKKTLRQPREELYSYLVGAFSRNELNDIVRAHLKKRKNWRDHEQPSLYGG